MKYTAEQKKTVLTLMERGWTYDQILEVPDYSHFDRQTLRAMKSNAAKAKVASVANSKRNATVKNNASQRDAAQNVEKAKQVKEPKTTAENAGFVATFAKTFHPVDLLFYASALVGCNGVSVALKSVEPVNYIVASVLFGVAFIALQELKSGNDWKRIFHVIALAFAEFAFCISDVYWANKALWAGVASLPVDVWVNKYRNDVGELVMLYGGPDVDKPFYIACGVAIILFSCAVYACAIALQQGKK